MPTRFFRTRVSVIGRSLRRCPLGALFGASIFGIVMADLGGTGWRIVALLALSLLVCSFLAQQRSWPGWSILGAMALFTLGFAWRQSDQLAVLNRFPLKDMMEQGTSVEIQGRGWICTEPARGEHSVSAILHLESMEVGGHILPTTHRLPVWIQRPVAELQYGSQVEFTGMVRPLEKPRGPGGFDARKFYFREHGSLARLEVRPGDPWKIQPGLRGFPIIRTALQLRKKLESGLRIGLSTGSETFAQIIAAMSLGIRESNPEEMEDHFRLSGTMHLFAVSGLHVAVVSGLLLGIAALARVPRRLALIVMIPVLLFYGVLTGLSPSAMRAAVMLSLVLLGVVLREQTRILNSLGLAGIILLAVDPQEIFLPGFQLSFAVIGGLALAARPLGEWVARPFLVDPFIPRTLLTTKQRWQEKAVQGLAGSCAVSVVAWFSSAGLLLWHFQSLTPIGLIANLFLIPLASGIISLAVTSLLCFGAHLTWVSAILNQINVVMAACLTALAQWFAEVPGGNWYFSPNNTDKITNNFPVQIDLLGERGESAALFTWRNGSNYATRHWLLDCGGPETYRRSLLPLLRSRSINGIEALALTHGDSGHLGAGEAVLSQFRPKVLIPAPNLERSPLWPGVAALARQQGLSEIPALAGTVLRIDSRSTWQLLAPRPEHPGRLADDQCLVVKMVSHGWTLLFTSDAGFATERFLLDSGAHLDADVWIRGQHSEDPSGLPEFVSAVSPKVVISGHTLFPRSEQIPQPLRQNLEKQSIPIYELDYLGLVSLHLNEKTLEIRVFDNPKADLNLSKSP
jgi:competence protein ComEC